ncbi:MAG: SHOCT domain-containing protein [Solirubrobacterales bacterium]
MMRGFGGMYGINQFGGSFPIWFMFGMMVLKLVVIAVIIFVAYKMYKKHNFKSFSAIGILNERFAKGEIDEEEYLKRKEVLKRK